MELIAKEGKSTTLELQWEVRLLSKNCYSLGQVENVGAKHKRKVWIECDPTYSSKRSCYEHLDHPHKGEEGKVPIGRKNPPTQLGHPGTWTE